MDVHFYIYLLIIQTQVSLFTKGQNTGKSRTDDKSEIKHAATNSLNSKESLEFLKKPKQTESDYFLPPVFNNDDHEDDGDDDAYLDYEYDKEIYKDSPDVSTSKPEVQDVLNFGDKLPMDTAKDNLPMFLLEPENTYVVKNKPATLKCRAANALEVFFKCNGDKIQTANFEFVDPHNGVRIVEAEHNVTRELVEEYFGTEKFQCSCVAWTSRGQIRSQPAFVELAYIKKQFTVSPQALLVKQYAQATFRCEPPPAAPFAQLYWLRNGVPVTVTDNTQVSKEGELVVKQASLLDMANYSCVAENLAGKRISEPALLTVFVNGGWTSWSAWSDCSCSDSPSSGRRRFRSCGAPRPLNGGQPCLGPAVQKTQDCLECDLDMYVDGLDDMAGETSDIVLGRWSQWSEWSRCDTDCLQSRRRRCATSSACLGKDYQVAQCPLCVRTSKSDGANDASSYWPLFIALSIALLIFIIVIILVVKYLKLKMSENSPYVKPPPGSNYFGSVIRRTLTNQPDITIHEEFQTISSKNRFTNTSTNNTQPRNEHLYEVPQLANSYITPLDQEASLNNVTSERNFVCKENSESDNSDSSCFMSSGSSYGCESVEMSPSLKNNLSLESQQIKTPNVLEVTASKLISAEGGRLRIERCDVSLLVPEGAVDDEDRELFSIEVNNEEWNRPILQEGETQLSPIIRCSLKNVHFRKAVVLSFPHCASIKNSTWVLSVFQKSQDTNSRHWSRVLTLGQESQGIPLFAQIDPGKVYLMSEYLSDFVLVGKSFSGLDAKVLKLGIFASKKADAKNVSSCNLRVHVFEDTLYALNNCIENERKIGGYLLSQPKCMYFQESCSDLCFNLRDVSVGWKLKFAANYQEIPFSKVWSTHNPLYCTYIFQQTDSINSLEFNLFVYQKQKQSNCVTFNLTSSDFNSNLSTSKRFSYTSIDKCYSANITENPFNYSSLTRNDGRYDFVYKNRNSFLKSNSSLCDNAAGLRRIDRTFLCKLLDVQNSKGNDWRLLAEKLKMDGYYYFFSNTCSPTEYILNFWEVRHNDGNMLNNLARTFREMSRMDCASIIERNCLTN